MSKRIWTATAVIGLMIGFAWYVSSRPMDFRVYYFGAMGVFDGTRPVYGESSGISWPLHYRYPPLFLFLVAPFTLLPLPWASAIWTLLKCGSLMGLTRSLWRRLPPSSTIAAWLVPLLLAGPYIVEDLRYGNAQSFIFVLAGAALLALPAAPFLAACSLALAISIKVWPLYFVPYLAARREWKVVGWTLVLTAALLLLPSFYFGLSGNLRLLAEWTRQEFSIQAGEAEIWFPSQSLRGVMMRYLTVIDYSQVPDSNYPLIQVVSATPGIVRLAWFALAGAIYCGLIVLTLRGKRESLLLAALAFSTLILVEPFSQKYTLVVLLWPALVAGRLVEKGRARGLLYAAAGIALVQLLVSSAAAQRLMQVLGVDFLITALLSAFLVISTRVPSANQHLS